MKTNENTEPSQPLRRLNPLNDFLFYKTMGEKGDEPQLTGFLNAVLVPSGRKLIETVEILDKKIYVKDLLLGKSCSLDVRAVLSDGTRVN
ncbi:MAG: Rpn family recombination-promoting nuclease/putative transposase, partial [Treponema sp.]|nr:Rpn family recombination-promoting nuclease/putative transposase [Treponema sp.]